MMDICKVFGNRLRAARKARAMTQGELAGRIGVTTNYISMIERGIKNPSLMTINRIAEGLHVRLPELLVDELPVTDRQPVLAS